MLYLSAQKITKAFGLNNLFSNISLNIFSSDRVGLIGPNGSGKSTLLKIFMDLLPADEGKITRCHHTQIVYLAQEDHFLETDSIKKILFSQDAELLSDEACQEKLRLITGEMLFSNLNQTTQTLSGGWRKRLSILRALLQSPDLLLMDEPTNHLDLEGILWLESLLKKSNFAFVIISHDRYFLQQSVNSVIELNKIYPDGYLKINGNYHHFLEKRSEWLNIQAQQEQTLSNKLRREKEWLSRMPKARTTKARYRIDQAEQLQSNLQEISLRNVKNKKATIDFHSTERKTKKLLAATQLGITRNKHCLFKNLDLILTPGSCIGLIGKNGSGKSTLIHLLNGNIDPDQGKIERAEHLRVVLFDQQRAQLKQNQTLKQALAPDGDSVFYKDQTIHVVAWAERFLFTPQQLGQPISTLSGGEQARVLIANLMREPADVLLLDEPTNDLDIPTLEVLEESLLEFSGAIVLITHDRFLLDRLSDALLYLDGNGKTIYFADYAQYRQFKENMHSDANNTSAKKSVGLKNKSLSYDEQRELNRLPDKIQKAEQALKLLEEKLYDPEIANDYPRLAEVDAKIKMTHTEIEQLYFRWEALEKLK